MLALVMAVLLVSPTMADPELDLDPEPVEMDGAVLSQTSLSLNNDTRSAQLTASPIPDSAAYDDLTWKSADPSVATVTVDATDSTKAVVMAVANGATDITATFTVGDQIFSASCAVTVSLYNGFNRDPGSGDWYYYTNGQVDTSITDVKQGTVDGVSGWWYILNGKVQVGFTGLADYPNKNGWWYIKNGQVDFTHNGVEKNKNGWWYVEGGKVQFAYTGVANYKNANGWWYIKDGKVDFSANTVAKNKNGWWYVLDGKVQLGFTGLADYRNANGWWYIKNGKVDFSHNGVDKNKNGWFYVVGGKVNFSYTGVANYKNKNGWWYIKNGKVDFSHNGVDKNKNGWFYVVGGKVDFSANTVAQNNKGWWYVTGGKVDFSVGDYSFAANTSQIIDVRASGNRGTLVLFNKSGNHFTKQISISCYVGRNGITYDKKEGDGKTPAGVYTLGQAFGVSTASGCTRSYLTVNSNYYWVDDSTSKYYNQLVNAGKTGIAWNSAEHLTDYPSAYKYAIAIDYNTDCVPNKGSAIFLHCSTGSATAGCVAVSESNMLKILQSLKDDTRIYIH